MDRETKRLEAVRAGQKRRWATPHARADFAFKIRGFHVPPDREAEYRHLLKIKHIPAREIAKIMGLV